MQYYAIQCNAVLCNTIISNLRSLSKIHLRVWSKSITWFRSKCHQAWSNFNNAYSLWPSTQDLLKYKKTIFTILHITQSQKHKAIVNVECFWIKCKLSYTEFNCSFKFMYNAANKSDWFTSITCRSRSVYFAVYLYQIYEISIF